MDLGLKGKVGMITGASRGIGAEISRELAREGCSLSLAARSAADLDQRVGEVRALGADALACPVDLQGKTSATKLLEATLARFERLDFVVANAGAARMGDFLSLTDEDWEQGFALKFFGHLRLLRAAWPHLKASRGSIVIIAGIAGRTPGWTSCITGAVNAALANLTKTLADRGVTDRVQVNAISPGPVRTGRYEGRIREWMARDGVSKDEAERRYVVGQGVTRIGEPADIAGLVAFLLSPRGSYLHGALIDMDGGKTKTL